jgi:methionine synthase I (cobalamin-dependent)
VLQALTFYASRDKLATVGLADKVEELNEAAVRIAKDAAADRCLVAGNISLTWMYEPDSAAARDKVAATFDEQLAQQADAGVDFIIGETFSWLGEARIAAERAKKTGLATMITMSFENEDVTPDGKTPADCARVLADAGADVVGINCLRNPDTTLPLAEQMLKAVDLYVATQPAAYKTPPGKPDFTSLPEFPVALDPLQWTRQQMARYATTARDMGVRYIGACCGAVATHIREMALALGKVQPDRRMWKTGGERPMSAVEYYGHDKK